MLDFDLDFSSSSSNSNQENPALYLHQDYAFIKPLEIKLDLLDCLYVESTPEHMAPDYNYESDIFKQQFKALINRYKILNLQLSPEANNDPFTAFQDEFLFDDFFSKFETYRQNNNKEYFGSIKKLLEENYIYLLSLESSQSATCQKELKEIINGIGACAPGVFTHLQDVNSRLKSQDNLVSWMADLRMGLVKIQADKHAVQFQNDPVYHAHVRQAFINISNRLGFNLPKDTAADPFEDSANISKRQIIEFLDYFRDSYQAKDLLDCLAMQFGLMLKKFNTKYQADANGWIQFDGQYSLIQKDGQAILNALSLSPKNNTDLSQLFDYSEDYTKLRIRQSFKDNLNVYIKDKLLKQNVLTTNKKKAYHLETMAYELELSRHANYSNEASLQPAPPQSSHRGTRDGFYALFLVLNVLSSILIYYYIAPYLGLIGVLNLSHLDISVIGGTLFSGFFMTPFILAHNKVLNYASQSYEALSDPELDALSDNERLAFKDGLEAQVSYKAQAASFFAWRDYRHMSAYYAGMDARISNNEELIDKMSPRA